MPLYRQLERQLTELIENGSLAPGTTLPAERQLAEKLGISRVTVQRSYNALRQRNLLMARGRLLVLPVGYPKVRPVPLTSPRAP